MSDIISKFQNKEIDIAKACLDYEEQKNSLTKAKADEVYDFLQIELEKCHQALCNLPGNESFSHTDFKDPELGYFYFAPPTGVKKYIRRK